MDILKNLLGNLEDKKYDIEIELEGVLIETMSLNIMEINRYLLTTKIKKITLVRE